ncbi:TetR/AcrR family transcriptional regulator [Massilia solisilvae]|uniref:TetR/AcrR family transcriptional regulator n=1 Tax=Massilia solisilvae TaxID=1811225 RepID=A0ABT2BEH7_9BURK|nr:TetR/AcrR family transcriptional regulator [Massilia solisilvae]MCS0606887.1 TetR/AcrR family transcriptional regulator [Massilia solisilvae]
MSKPSQDCSNACLKGAGRPKAAEVEARMHDLIETAGALFLSQGYTKVSLEAIAREAHVAVRTIYVKFGGKAGLLNAVIQSRRDRFFNVRDMATDSRPFKEIVDDFGRHFLALLWAPEALCMQRVIIAEAATNPELAETFENAGPKPTREMLSRFFARPDIRAQLRPDLPFDALPTFLLNCVAGDLLMRFLSPQPKQSPEEMQRALDERLSLFYRAVLKES